MSNATILGEIHIEITTLKTLYSLQEDSRTRLRKLTIQLEDSLRNTDGIEETYGQQDIPTINPDKLNGMSEPTLLYEATK